MKRPCQHRPNLPPPTKKKTLQSLSALLLRLRSEGYDVGPGAPETGEFDGEALVKALQAR